MQKYFTRFAIFFFLLLSLAGAGCTAKPTTTAQCGRPPVFLNQRPSATSVALVSPNLFQIAKSIAFQLKINLKEGPIDQWPCIVTTFVDIDNLEQSTRFGRVLAESVGAELFKQGAVVKDVRPAKALYFQPGTGEMILSRDAKRLAANVRARAALAGTYSKGHHSVIVNVKFIDLYTGKVLSVAGEEIALTESVKTLLGTSTRPEDEEAIPTTYDTEPL